MQNRNGYGQAGRVKGYVEFHREPSSRSQTRPSSEVKSNRNRSIKTMKKNILLHIQLLNWQTFCTESFDEHIILQLITV